MGHANIQTTARYVRASRPSSSRRRRARSIFCPTSDIGSSAEPGRDRADAASTSARSCVSIATRSRPAQRLSPAQRRVLTNIAQCRTAALGGHLDVCLECDYERPAYNSCRDRHCPKCQALAQEAWIVARSEQLLDVGHFHVVFTVPSQLRPLAKFAPSAVYGALFKAASETLRDLADTKLDATLGVTMVLHTWTRELLFHPRPYTQSSRRGGSPTMDRHGYRAPSTSSPFV